MDRLLQMMRIAFALWVLVLPLFVPSTRLAASPTASDAFFDRTGKVARAPFETLADLDTALQAVADGAQTEAFWQKVRSLGQMPLVFGKSAVFLYRGSATSVSWTGDFSFWQPANSLAGRRLGRTDIWTARQNFPPAARLDYNVSVDGRQSLDPLNPLTQTDGYARHSVLTMPDFRPSRWTEAQPGIGKGALSASFVLQSKHLGYAKRFQVYTPAGYEQLKDLPVVYVTDGHEYADARMGALPIILDNLIAEGAIPPVMAVLVDPRSVETLQNRRGPELLTNPRFQWFLTQELIPWIDARYPTLAKPEARAIVGNSLGGLHSTYTAVHQSEWFGLAGVLSPYFKAKPAVLREVEKAGRLPVRFFVIQGAYDLDIANTRRLRDVLQAKGHELQYVETYDGHSWGNWRGVVDDMLVYFFAEQPHG